MVTTRCPALFLRRSSVLTDPHRKQVFKRDELPLRVLEMPHLVPPVLVQASAPAEPRPAVKIVFRFSSVSFSLCHLVPFGPLKTGACFLMTPKSNGLFHLVRVSCAVWTQALLLVLLVQYLPSTACCVCSQVHLVPDQLPHPEHCRKS